MTDPDLTSLESVKQNRGGELLGVVGFFLLIGLISVAWVGKSSMEARAYNKVTGSSVSTWEAMFIELRVQSGPSQ